jgi:hypothetical protein
MLSGVAITTDNNLVILAAARNNEVAWDTSKGGALTYNFGQCLDGSAADSDHSGSISMRELAACVQARNGTDSSTWVSVEETD